MLPNLPSAVNECVIRGISHQVIADVQASQILLQIADPESNTEHVKLEVAPKIAVYSPSGKQPWDDAVTLVLTYAEIPYEVVYDAEIMAGTLPVYDWLHLHHEDFTGQYGKFYRSYRSAAWYQDEVQRQEGMARTLGFEKVSVMKRNVALNIRDFILGVKLLNGRGEIVNFGGRVIKNVAGFDVSRLMVGALGTLGILLEVSIRVIPKFEAETTLSFEHADVQTHRLGMKT